MCLRNLFLPWLIPIFQDEILFGPFTKKLLLSTVSVSTVIWMAVLVLWHSTFSYFSLLFNFNKKKEKIRFTEETNNQHNCSQFQLRQISDYYDAEKDFSRILGVDQDSPHKLESWTISIICQPAIILVESAFEVTVRILQKHNIHRHSSSSLLVTAFHNLTISICAIYALYKNCTPLTFLWISSFEIAYNIVDTFVMFATKFEADLLLHHIIAPCCICIPAFSGVLDVRVLSHLFISTQLSGFMMVAGRFVGRLRGFQGLVFSRLKWTVLFVGMVIGRLAIPIMDVFLILRTAFNAKSLKLSQKEIHIGTLAKAVDFQLKSQVEDYPLKESHCAFLMQCLICFLSLNLLYACAVWQKLSNIWQRKKLERLM